MKCKLLLMLLSLLGMAACNDDDDNQLVMYGCPHGDYTVYGKVTDTAGTPIPNILITESDAYKSGFPVATTDENGAYDFQADRYVEGLRAIDVDGEQNGGLFAPWDFPAITFTEADRTEPGDGDWYEGRFEKRFDVTLERDETKEQ